MEKFISYYPQPVFRNTYNIVLGVNHRSGINFDYCDNCKQWIAIKGGNEVGLINKEGIEYAERLVAPYFRTSLEKQGYSYNPNIVI